MKISRRNFMAGVGGSAVFPVAARAQQPGAMRRISVLTNVAESDRDEQARLAGFREELRRRGWIEGTSIQFDYYWTAGNDDLARKFAAEIVGMKPGIIFVVGTTTVASLLENTRLIPIVFVTASDPVNAGFVNSLARPGGNATGFAGFEDAMGTKWLQLLKEIAPAVARVLFIHSDSRANQMLLPALQHTAAANQVELLQANVHDALEIERALDAHAGENDLGLIVPPNSIVGVHRKLVIARAAQYGFPAVYANRRFTADGGLMSYGIDRVEQYRRGADYVDRILKGTKPDDLPVQQLEKLEFVFNLKTANALGLNVPRIVLARADEVIE
jgi:putative ABC transport system substrate-binding protein